MCSTFHSSFVWQHKLAQVWAFIQVNFGPWKKSGVDSLQPMDAFHETKVYYNSEEIDLHYVVWYVN